MLHKARVLATIFSITILSCLGSPTLQQHDDETARSTPLPVERAVSVDDLTLSGKPLPPLKDRQAGQALRALRSNSVDFNYENMGQMGVWDDDEDIVFAPDPQPLPAFSPRTLPSGVNVHDGGFVTEPEPEHEHEDHPFWHSVLWALTGVLLSAAIYFMKTGRILFFD